MGTNNFIKLLPDMVSFVRVAELGSFRAAAAQLGVTPSAISRQVTRLEKALGVQLAQHTAITHPQDLARHSCLSLGEQPHDNHWCFQRNDDSLEVAEVTVHGR